MNPIHFHIKQYNNIFTPICYYLSFYEFSSKYLASLNYHVFTELTQEEVGQLLGGN